MVEYHRGKMKLTGDPYDNPYSHGLLKPKCLSLEERLKSAGLPNGLDKDKVILLTAILRFLDGCDVQADRAGEPEYQDRRSKRTRLERTVLEKRLAEVEAMMVELKIPASADCHYMQYQQAVTRPDPLQLLAVSLRDQIEFKGSPDKHFAKHTSISLVYLRKTDGGRLRVCIVPSGTKDIKTIGQDILGEYAGTEGKLKAADRKEELLGALSA